MGNSLLLLPKQKVSGNSSHGYPFHNVCYTTELLFSHTTVLMFKNSHTIKTANNQLLKGSFLLVYTRKKTIDRDGDKKNAKLVIKPTHVPQIVLQFGGKKIQLGYESLMSVVVGNRRMTELPPGEAWS